MKKLKIKVSLLVWEKVYRESLQPIMKHSFLVTIQLCLRKNIIARFGEIQQKFVITNINFTDRL